MKSDAFPSPKRSNPVKKKTAASPVRSKKQPVKPDLNFEDLSMIWSQTDSEGLVAVIPTESFQVGAMLTVQLAKLADMQQHDPEVSIEPSKVTIRLISHDTGTVTDRDFTYAHVVDTMLGFDDSTDRPSDS